MLLIAICFETFQQMYYIKRFSLVNDVYFFDILKNHAYRWIIWLLIALLLPVFIKKNNYRSYTISIFFKHFSFIVFLVLLNVFIISVIQMITSENSFSLFELITEYCTFFLYQKAPVYTLGYIAITIILVLNFEKELLEIEVQDLKISNDEVHKKLTSKTSDKIKVLTRRGTVNTKKIIPVNDITWVEADDYCVIVHAINMPSYTMRISLKALQEILSDNFLRVHRKGIVNMDMVKELSLSSKPSLHLMNNDEVLISKSNLKKVKDFLG